MISCAELLIVKHLVYFLVLTLEHLCVKPRFECVPDRAELHAQVPAPHSPGAPASRVLQPRVRPGAGEVQDLHIPGNRIHGCDCISEPVGETTHFTYK